MPEICQLCGKPIEGQVEELTKIWIGDGSTHLFCLHDRTTLEEGSLELPSWALDKLSRINPARARYFRAMVAR